MVPDLPPLDLNRLGYQGPLLEVPARRWQGGQASNGTESLIEEVPIVFVFNQIPHVVMMATPTDLEDFALGFVLTEGMVSTKADLLGLDVVRYSQGIELQIQVAPAIQAGIETRARRLSGRTGCGICGQDSVEAVLKSVRRVPPGGRITPQAIGAAIEALSNHQPLNAAAGAVHAAAWASHDGQVALVREDVGRHNALDKLVGSLVKAAVDPGVGFVVVTSRASFEMVQKTTYLGAPIMVAVSGPTALAVRLADAAGLTLVGFARPGRCTAYTHPDRIATQ